jgi:hypothetical protein
VLAQKIGIFDVERVIEYPDLGPSPSPCPELLRKVLNEIPMPYSFTALRWHEGVDIKNGPATLWTLSRSMYYTHRKKLLEYGIGMCKKCNVKALYYKLL